MSPGASGGASTRTARDAVPERGGPRPSGFGRVRRVGLAIVFLWFSIGGVAHFVVTDLEMRIVPPWVPWPRAAVLVSGAFELLGAAGLLFQPTRRLAGWGLFALTLLVTPAHLYMLERPDLFPAVPHWALVARLPLQAALLVLIVWSTAGAVSPAPRRPRPTSR